MRIVSALLVCSVALGACEPKPAPPKTALEYTQNAKRDYERALEKYFDRDWEEATERFTDVKRNYGYTRYARLAELRIADAKYRQKEYAEAVSAYRDFVHDHPNDPEVPYARYKITKALYQDTEPQFLLAPLEERDLVNVLDAYDSIREMIGDYPVYKHRAELDFMLEVVTGMLARHDLYVARFYLRERRYEAVVARIESALTRYQNSGLEAEALVLLGETYLRMKEPKKARAAFERVVHEYPATPFIVPAKNFLDRMGDG
jgi:outer membrane protein assembly factor BamD